MKLSFLIPFRDVDGTRTAGHQWLLKRWQHFYPEAEFCIASDDGVDPFNKSLAINNAAKQATGDIFLILDADTWVEPKWVNEAIARIADGIPWVVPCIKNMRMKQDFSEQLMKLDPTGPLPPIQNRNAETVGPVVGFLHIMPRKAFEAVGGYDERIRGWGGEDTSFTWAMDIINGRHRKLHGVAMCLWHERPRDKSKFRIWYGQDRTHQDDKKRVVSAYNKALVAKDKKAAMLQALER